MNKQPSCKLAIPLLLMVIAFMGVSCKKYLNEAPITSTYGREFWSSQTSVEQATLAMYGQLRSCLRSGQSHFIFGDITSGVFLPASNNSNFQVKASTSPPFNFSYVPYKEGQLQNWSRFYQLIAQCNLILQNVPQMASNLFVNEDIRKGYLGEALFMRAYAYFYIIRVWGDPVFVTQSYNDVDYGNIPPLARTKESVVLDSCIADLNRAAGYLGFGGGNPVRSVRATKGAVQALLAHMYAWKHDYANAHLSCQQLLANGGYSLEPMASYKNIWKGQSSNESIFELSMTYNPNDPNFSGQGDWAEAQFDFFAVFLKGPVVDNRKVSSWVSPKGGFVDQFMDTLRDARYKATLAPTPASGGDMAGYLLVKYANFLYQKPDTKTLPYINNSLVLFRLADIILLDAEALAYQNDLGGAKQKLALTEGRAGITAYQAPASQYDILDEVIAERGRELIGEGQWYYDLIRTETKQGWLEYVGYPSDRVTPANKGYYWPLDMAALFPQDNLLTQNPWWATHK
ncbi:MAG: RagB/SusD family nutrient uptake outer membrane protein [Williamsia sp.]|nr:RagB/SusD family nutrient uptake outer membrane protein [Williamsia sp.]